MTKEKYWDASEMALIRVCHEDHGACYCGSVLCPYYFGNSTDCGGVEPGYTAGHEAAQVAYLIECQWRNQEQIRILTKTELYEFATSIPVTIETAMLLGGDRLTCCDEAVAMVQNDCIVGVATIALDGEMASGIPTIVATYVLPDHRGQGYGYKLLEAAIRRLTIDRSVEEKILVETTTEAGKRTVDGLRDDLKESLQIRHMVTDMSRLVAQLTKLADTPKGE